MSRLAIARLQGLFQQDFHRVVEGRIDDGVLGDVHRVVVDERIADHGAVAPHGDHAIPSGVVGDAIYQIGYLDAPNRFAGCFIHHVEHHVVGEIVFPGAIAGLEDKHGGGEREALEHFSDPFHKACGFNPTAKIRTFRDMVKNNFAE